MLKATVGEHFVWQIEKEIERIAVGHLQDGDVPEAIARLHALADTTVLFRHTPYGPLLHTKINAAIQHLSILVARDNPRQMTNLIMKWVKQFDHLPAEAAHDGNTSAVVSIAPSQPVMPVRQGPTSMLPVVVLLAMLLDLLYAKNGRKVP